jgi:hypothetical protein
MKIILNKSFGATTFAVFVIGWLAISCSEDEKGIAYSPAITAPTSGASNQSPEVTLQWEDTDPVSAYELYTFDVYIGTSENNLQLVASDLLNEEFKCSALALNAMYFWKVVAKANGESKESAVGEFVTDQELQKIKVGDKTLMVFPGDYVHPDPGSVMGYSSNTLAGASNWEDGELNTTTIINYYGENHSRGWGVAADYCDKLNAYGHTDWYLPAILEIDAVATENNLLKYATDEYWSSTEWELDANRDLVLTKSLSPYPGVGYSVADKIAYHSIKCRCVRED